MILKEILIELRRIASALEKQNGIEEFPLSMKTAKPVIPTMSSSNIVEFEETERESKLEEAKEAFKTAAESGLFFPEDGMPEDLLDNLQ